MNEQRNESLDAQPRLGAGKGACPVGQRGRDGGALDGTGSPPYPTLSPQEKDPRCPLSQDPVLKLGHQPL